MKSSIRDKAEGTAKQASGKVKEVAGRATNNKSLEGRGTAEKTAGKVQKKVGDVKKVFNR